MAHPFSYSFDSLGYLPPVELYAKSNLAEETVSEDSFGGV
jgi:hypothetical protein